MEEQIKSLLADVILAKTVSVVLPSTDFGDGVKKALDLVEARLREILSETY